jgi:tetratricopeptide (TPR) repeat protein
MRSKRLWFLVVLLMTGIRPLPFIAQRPENPQDLWLQRIKILTDDLLKDSSSLTTLDQALILGRLGDAWWKTDPARARRWMLKAVEAVEQIPSRENQPEHTKRISVALTLLKIISTRDEKLGNRLQALLTSDASSSEAEKTANADGLIDAALALVDADPRRAESMGSLSLRVGLPTLIHHLLVRLRIRDSVLADRLFKEALGVARKRMDEEFLNSLRYAAFPELYGPGLDASSVPPESLRLEVLRLLEDDLQQQVAVTESSGAPNCGVAASMLGPLQPQFDRLEPQRADLARQLIRRCQEKLSPTPGKSTSDSPDEGSLITIDDFLNAAERAGDGSKERAIYFGKAARLAAQQKNFERAISILERMNDSERQFIGIWETWRRDWAASLAIEYLKRDDLPGMHGVIKAVPDNLRAFTQIYVVDKMPRGAAADVGIELLGDARRGLSKSDKPDSEKLHWHMMLVRLYAKYDLTADALDSFKLAVAALNRSGGDDNAKKETLDDFDTRLIQDSFPASLLDPIGFGIRDVVLSVSSVHRRTQTELGLIRVSIKRYQELASMYPTKTGAKK